MVLTLEKKLSILDRLKSGETPGKLATEYGVGRSTIGDINKTQDKLKSFASTMENFAMSLKKCTLHVSGIFTYPAVPRSRP